MISACICRRREAYELCVAHGLCPDLVHTLVEKSKRLQRAAFASLTQRDDKGTPFMFDHSLYDDIVTDLHAAAADWKESGLPIFSLPAAFKEKGKKQRADELEKQILQRPEPAVTASCLDQTGPWGTGATQHTSVANMDELDCEPHECRQLESEPVVPNRSSRKRPLPEDNSKTGAPQKQVLRAALWAGRAEV